MYLKKLLSLCTVELIGTVVVAQLAERSPPIPEIRGSNPVIGKIIYCLYLLFTAEKTKLKKRPDLAYF